MNNQNLPGNQGLPNNQNQGMPINSNYQPKKSKNGKYAFISFILILLIGALAYVAYTTISKDNKKEEEKPDTKKEEKITEKEVKDYLAKMIHTTKEGKNDIYQILYMGEGLAYDMYEIYYVDKFKLADSIDENTKYTFATSLIDKENVKTTSLLDLYEQQKTQYVSKTEFKIEDLKTSYLNLFGHDKTFTAKKFMHQHYGECNVVGDKYECYAPPGGGIVECFGSNLYVKFDKFEIKDDLLNVYEKGIYLDCDENSKKYYKTWDSYGQPDIATLKGLSLEEVLSNKEYDKELVKYVHTFKKNKDGTYYLYSNEQIK